MADPKIKLKRSAVAGKIPTPDQLPLGEVALNTFDGYLYASKNVGVGTTVIALNPFRVGTGTDTYNAYFTAGDVGIGTTNPKAKLEINVGSATTALDIQGSAGQLFSVTNNLTSGSIFSVNDVSGIPSIDVNADGTIQLAPYGSTEYVGIGTTNPTSKLDVTGHVNVSGVVTATSFSGSGSNLTGLTGASAATYGDANATPVIVVDSDGRITGISTVAISGSGSLATIVEDTTPQLGGDLDLNSNDITGTGNVNITGVVTATSFVGSVTGTASTADTLKTVNTPVVNANHFITFVDTNNSTSTAEVFKTDNGLYYNPYLNQFAANGVNTGVLSLNSVDVTATAAELNILDGVTASTSELNILDGVTATTSELNVLDGITATTSELNLTGDLGTFTGSTISDNATIKAALQEIETSLESISGGDAQSASVAVGATNTNASHYITFVDSNNTSPTQELIETDAGISYNPSSNVLTVSGSVAANVTGTASTATVANTVLTRKNETSGTYYFTFVDDNNTVASANELYTDTTLNLNPFTNIVSGGGMDMVTYFKNSVEITASAAEQNILDGATLSTSELNILDGATLSTSELNILDGVTATTSEINVLDGATAGSAVASKALVVDASRDIDNLNSVTATTFSGSLSGGTVSATTGTFTGDVSFGSTATFGDNNRLNFGDGNDLSIYHTGSISYISDQGTGALRILSNAVKIRNAADTEQIANFTQNGSVELYYDNSKKFETTGYGVTVFGTTQTQQLNVTGVSTFTSTVEITPSSDVQGLIIDTTNVTTENNAHLTLKGGGPQVIDFRDNGGGNGIRISYRTTPNEWRLENSESNSYYYIVADRDDGRVDLYHGGSKKFETTSSGVSVTGISTATVLYGTGGTYADGVDTVTDAALIIGRNAAIYTDDGDYLRVLIEKQDDVINIGQQNTAIIDGIELKPGTTGGRVKLHAGGSSDNVKLETTGGGVIVTGITTTDGLSLGDNDKLRLGDGDDLQIFHDGSNSYVRDLGTGILRIETDGSSIGLRKTSGESMGVFNTDGSVDLYYDNSKKFETTGAGATVYGTTQTQQLNVSGVSTFASDINIGDKITYTDSSDILKFGDDAQLRFGDGNDLQIYHNGSYSYIKDTGTGALIINSDSVVIKNAGDTEDIAKFTQNGAVELYYDNAKKFETTADGIKVRPNVGLGTVAGNSQDLAIFETTNNNGSKLRIIEERDVNGTTWTSAYTRIQKTIDVTDQAYIQFNGDGNTYGMEFGNAANGEKFAEFKQNSSVDLYHNGVKKFETASYGIYVTGAGNTSTIAGAANLVLDPSAVGDNTGTVTILGNLQVDGTQTVINSTTMTVDDLNITLASGAANASAANGAGITVDGASATLTYASSGDKWVFNKAPYYNSDRLLTTADEGTGNGIDADTVDGIEAASFLRSNAADTATGDLTIEADLIVNTNTNSRFLYISRSGSTGNEYTRIGRDDLITHFHTKNDEETSTVRFRFENTDTESGGGASANTRNIDLISDATDARITIDGNRVLTTADEGTGNGIDADTVDGIEASSFLRSDAADTASGSITFSGGQTWNSHITWNNGKNIYIAGESSFDVSSGGTWQAWDASTSSTWITASHGQPLVLNSNALTTTVKTSGSSDYFRIYHRTDTDITMDFYCESGTAQIADTFTDTTTDKKYIYFGNPNSSNDPGFIMHETSNSETNEGVLHLVPSDDNATNDYVSIHGTNDADQLRLHTSGLVESVAGQLELKSGSGGIYLNDDVGIGTDNPGAKLDVRGDTRLFGGSLNVNNSETGADYGHIKHNDNYHAIILRGFSSNTSGTPSATNQMSFVEYGGIFNFYKTNGTVNNNFVRFREDGDSWINTSGNVGVGTNSPSTKLDVRGGSILVDAFNTSGDHGIFFRNGFDSSNSPYNISILAYDHSGSHKDGLSINGYDGVSFCTGSNTRQERLRITSAGDVGIGITNPAGKLHISSGTSGDCELILEADTDNNTETDNPRILFRQDGGNDWSAIGNGVNGTSGSDDNALVLANSVSNYGGIIFQTNNNDTGYSVATEKARISSDGNLGIGNNNPAVALDLGKTKSTNQIKLKSSDGNVDMRINPAYGSADVASLTVVSAHPLTFHTNNTERVRITSAGNFGIGTNNPQANFVISNSGNNGLEFDPENSSGTNRILSYNRNSSQRTKLEFDASEIFVTNNTTEYLRLNSTGLGIGTNSPSTSLHVSNGTSGFSGSYNARTAAVVEGDDSGGTTLSILAKSSGYSGIFFGDESSETRGQIQYVHSNDAFRFITDGGTEALRLDGGKVGIGTDSPDQELHVVGQIKISDSNYARVEYARNDTNLWSVGLRDTDDFIVYRESGSGNVIFPHGDVGIGTTNPSDSLHVYGDGSAIFGPGSAYGKFLKIGADSSAAPDSNTANIEVTNGNLHIDAAEGAFGVFLNYYGGTAGTLFGNGSNGSVGKFHNDGSLTVNTTSVTGTSSQKLNVNGGAHVSGDVGIGTTNPSQKLSVYNSTPSDTGGVLVQNVNYSNSQDKPYLVVGTKSWTGATTNWNTYGFQHKVKSNSGGAPRITVDTSSGEKFCIENAGDVGIGTNAPDAKLDVRGHIKVDDGPTLENGGGGDLQVTTSDGYIRIGPVNGSFAHVQTDRSKFYFNKKLIVDTGTISSYNEDLILQTDDNGGGDERVRILASNGNLGVGATSPGEKLDVRGNIRVGGTDTGPNYIAFRGTTGDQPGSYNHGYIGERIYNQTEQSELLIAKGNDIPTTGGGADRVRIAAAEFRVDTYDSASGSSGTFEQVATNSNLSNRFVVTSGGNVGVGLTNPGYELEVAGDIKLADTGTLWFSDTSGSVEKIKANTSSLDYYSDSVHRFYESDTNAERATFDVNNASGRLYFDGDSNTYFTREATDCHVFVNAGSESVRINASGDVGIGTAAPGYKLHVLGSFAATTKSFVIDHPTKEGMKLRYGSLEGPENGVYVRGRLKGNDTIELPDYWTGLVDEETITVNLTPIGRKAPLHSVVDIAENTVIVESANDTIDCFYTVFGERKDVEKLEVEF